MRNPLHRLYPGSPSHRCIRCRLAHRECLCDLIPRIETRTRVVLVLHQLEDRKTTNTGRLALRCLPNSEIVIRGDPSRARTEARQAPNSALASDAQTGGGQTGGGQSSGGQASDGQASDGHSSGGYSSGGHATGDPRAAPTAPLPLAFAAAAQPVDWTAHGDPVLLFPHPDARPIESWRGHPRPLTLIVPDGTWRQGQRVRHRIAGLDGVPCASVARDGPSRYRLRTTADPRRLATLEAIAEALGVLEGDEPREALLRIFDVMVERSLRARAGGS